MQLYECSLVIDKQHETNDKESQAIRAGKCKNHKEKLQGINLMMPKMIFISKKV